MNRQQPLLPSLRSCSQGPCSPVEGDHSSTQLVLHHHSQAHLKVGCKTGWQDSPIGRETALVHTELLTVALATALQQQGVHQGGTRILCIPPACGPQESPQPLHGHYHGLLPPTQLHSPVHSKCTLVVRACTASSGKRWQEPPSGGRLGERWMEAQPSSSPERPSTVSVNV